MSGKQSCIFYSNTDEIYKGTKKNYSYQNAEIKPTYSIYRNKHLRRVRIDVHFLSLADWFIKQDTRLVCHNLAMKNQCDI